METTSAASEPKSAPKAAVEKLLFDWNQFNAACFSMLQRSRCDHDKVESLTAENKLLKSKLEAERAKNLKTTELLDQALQKHQAFLNSQGSVLEYAKEDLKESERKRVSSEIELKFLKKELAAFKDQAILSTNAQLEAAKEKLASLSGTKLVKGKDELSEGLNPSEDELRCKIVQILDEDDMNTTTFNDIVKKLAAHYDMDFTPRKEELKRITDEELAKLVDEEEVTEEECEGDEEEETEEECEGDEEEETEEEDEDEGEDKGDEEEETEEEDEDEGEDEEEVTEEEGEGDEEEKTKEKEEDAPAAKRMKTDR